MEILLKNMKEARQDYEEMIRDFAIDYQNLFIEDNLYYSEIAEFQATMSEMLADFKELEEELKENGII